VQCRTKSGCFAAARRVCQRFLQPYKTCMYSWMMCSVGRKCMSPYLPDPWGIRRPTLMMCVGLCAMRTAPVSSSFRYAGLQQLPFHLSYSSFHTPITIRSSYISGHPSLSLRD
jgi:hypothetical protein